MVGRTIANYEILAKRGGGAMGVVYTARDTRRGCNVAVKFLSPQWSHDESARERFTREALAASAIEHRNVCNVYGLEAAEDGEPFIVMADYSGETLKQKLNAGPMGIAEALEIAAQIADGLAAVHARGVLHRDIKPANLMIQGDTVKILDFGLAKFAESVQLTTTGATVGTITYMSPEQARGEEADARSDIWSVGIVLYEMLTGRPPFAGSYPEALTYAIRNDEPPAMQVGGKRLPRLLQKVVFRALAKNPARRFQTASELEQELRRIQARMNVVKRPSRAPVSFERLNALCKAFWNPRPTRLVEARMDKHMQVSPVHGVRYPYTLADPAASAPHYVE